MKRKREGLLCCNFRESGAFDNQTWIDKRKGGEKVLYYKGRAKGSVVGKEEPINERRGEEEGGRDSM